MLSEREGEREGGRAPLRCPSLTHGPSAHSVTDTFLLTRVYKTRLSG